MAKKVQQPHGGAVNQFEKGESGNPNGRPPKIFSSIARQFKAQGYERATPSRVAEIYEYLLALPLKNIIEINGNPRDEITEASNEYPALLRIVAAEMIGKRRLEVVQEILNRAHGRPSQALDLRSGGEPVGPFTGFDFLKPLAVAPSEGDAPNGRPGDDG